MDQYEKIQILGRGAFGVATLVQQKKAGRRSPKYVVKEVSLASLPQVSQREALTEVGVLRQLTHPHIVAYIDTFFTESNLVIVMEFADGGDLASEVKRRKEDEDPFSTHRALTIFAQCLLALQYIHQKRILHRDIKCQNIFLTASGTVKVGDFGIARIMEFTAAMAGTLIGTPDYLSPEAVENQPYGSKADVWAIGVVLYELFTLAKPFASSNMAALVIKIITGTPPPIPEAYGEEAQNLIDKVLNKTPDKRPTVDELLMLPVVHTYVPAEQELTQTGSKQFEKIQKLGQGAFGTATLMKYSGGARRGMYCVDKEVLLNSVPDSEHKGALAEVDLLRRLSHPNIIAYFDCFIEDMVLHIVLEYAKGGDLAKKVRERAAETKTIGEHFAMTVFGQCLLALKYIHMKHILHRDIKCQNIFLMDNSITHPVAKLGDFGISKVTESTLEVAGTVIGTPGYLAPEVCENAPYGVKADVWSIGVVLYELLALKQPFTAHSLPALIMRIVSAEPPPLPEACSQEVDQLIKLTLQKKSDVRPTAAQLLENERVRQYTGERPASPNGNFDKTDNWDSVALGGTSFDQETAMPKISDDTGFTMSPMDPMQGIPFDEMESTLAPNGDVEEQTLAPSAPQHANRPAGCKDKLVKHHDSVDAFMETALDTSQQHTMLPGTCRNTVQELENALLAQSQDDPSTPVVHGMGDAIDGLVQHTQMICSPQGEMQLSHNGLMTRGASDTVALQSPHGSQPDVPQKAASDTASSWRSRGSGTEVLSREEPPLTEHARREIQKNKAFEEEQRRWKMESHSSRPGSGSSTAVCSSTDESARTRRDFLRKETGDHAAESIHRPYGEHTTEQHWRSQLKPPEALAPRKGTCRKEADLDPHRRPPHGEHAADAMRRPPAEHWTESHWRSQAEHTEALPTRKDVPAETQRRRLHHENGGDGPRHPHGEHATENSWRSHVEHNEAMPTRKDGQWREADPEPQVRRPHGNNAGEKSRRPHVDPATENAWRPQQEQAKEDHRRRPISAGVMVTTPAEAARQRKIALRQAEDEKRFRELEKARMESRVDSQQVQQRMKQLEKGHNVVGTGWSHGNSYESPSHESPRSAVGSRSGFPGSVCNRLGHRPITTRGIHCDSDMERHEPRSPIAFAGEVVAETVATRADTGDADPRHVRQRSTSTPGGGRFRPASGSADGRNRTPGPSCKRGALRR